MGTEPAGGHGEKKEYLQRLRAASALKSVTRRLREEGDLQVGEQVHQHQQPEPQSPVQGTLSLTLAADTQDSEENHHPRDTPHAAATLGVCPSLPWGSQEPGAGGEHVGADNHHQPQSGSSFLSEASIELGSQPGLKVARELGLPEGAAAVFSGGPYRDTLFALQLAGVACPVLTSEEREKEERRKQAATPSPPAKLLRVDEGAERARPEPGVESAPVSNRAECTGSASRKAVCRADDVLGGGACLDVKEQLRSRAASGGECSVSARAASGLATRDDRMKKSSAAVGGKSVAGGGGAAIFAGVRAWFVEEGNKFSTKQLALFKKHIRTHGGEVVEGPPDLCHAPSAPTHAILASGPKGRDESKALPQGVTPLALSDAGCMAVDASYVSQSLRDRAVPPDPGPYQIEFRPPPDSDPSVGFRVAGGGGGSGGGGGGGGGGSVSTGTAPPVRVKERHGFAFPVEPRGEKRKGRGEFNPMGPLPVWDPAVRPRPPSPQPSPAPRPAIGPAIAGISGRSTVTPRFPLTQRGGGGGGGLGGGGADGGGGGAADAGLGGSAPHPSEESDQTLGSREHAEVIPSPIKGHDLIGEIKTKGYLSRGRKNWACQKGLEPTEEAAGGGGNLNEHLTIPLATMKELHKANDTHNSAFRIVHYDKMVNAFRAAKFRIETVEDLKRMPGWGSKTCPVPNTPDCIKKIEQILATGTFDKLESFSQQEGLAAIRELVEVWGVGITKARSLQRLGIKSVDDLRKAVRGEGGFPDPKLTAQQLVGLERHEDIQARIPRSEVAEIEAMVRKAAKDLCPGAHAQACGSYRRGKESAGDVDVLITHKNEELLENLMPRLLGELHDNGFLTDDLSVGSGWDKTDRREGKPTSYGSYMGVCRLSPAHRHRRLDIKVYSLHTYPFAVLYFTGSSHFNRSMRLWSKKHGMSLSDTGLVRAIRKPGIDALEGTLSVFCRTEEDIFRALNLEYVPPEQRSV